MTLEDFRKQYQAELDSMCKLERIIHNFTVAFKVKLLTLRIKMGAQY